MRESGKKDRRSIGSGITSQSIDRSVSPLGSTGRRISADRFIPKVEPQSDGFLRLKPAKSPKRFLEEDLKKQNDFIYSDTVYRNIVETQRSSSGKKFLNYSQKSSVSNIADFNKQEFDSGNEYLLKRLNHSRRINKNPIATIPISGLLNDYYISVFDWGLNGQLSYASTSSLNIYRYQIGKQPSLFHIEPLVGITAVKYRWDGVHLALGEGKGRVGIFDSEKCMKVTELNPHQERVTCMGWRNEILLATGSRDRTINLIDSRTNQSAGQFWGHRQEICGIFWQPGGGLLASGGNDNLIFIWDPRSNRPLFEISGHKAAVKALAWNPHNFGELLSGGGTADASIKLWNLNSVQSRKPEQIFSVEAGGQVCSLLAPKSIKEFVAGMGYPNNDIKIFDLDNGERIANIDGHLSRVLHMNLGEDENDIVASLSADQSIKFWNFFQREKLHTESKHRLRQRSIEFISDIR